MNTYIFSVLSLESLVQSGFILLSLIVGIALAAWGILVVIKSLLPYVFCALDAYYFDKSFEKLKSGKTLSDDDVDILWRGSEDA